MPGPFFDGLTVGQTFRRAIRRTIAEAGAEAGNAWFSALAHGPALPHPDEGHRHPETGSVPRALDSASALRLTVGLSVGGVTPGTAVARPGWDEGGTDDRAGTVRPAQSGIMVPRTGGAAGLDGRMPDIPHLVVLARHEAHAGRR